jgi:hypothetical protein
MSATKSEVTLEMVGMSLSWQLILQGVGGFRARLFPLWPNWYWYNTCQIGIDL